MKHARVAWMGAIHDATEVDGRLRLAEPADRPTLVLNAETAAHLAERAAPGERAHYELAAGRADTARRFARAMETLAGDSGLLAEQIWDSADISERELYLGHASGSAMPLVWAHAEYLKLCRSLRDGEVFDRPGVKTVIVFIDASAPANTEELVHRALAYYPLPYRLQRGEEPRA